ncbi:MAG TPA: FimV/HubP family polar landmark protein [Acidiferrobacterales bacterium]
MHHKVAGRLRITGLVLGATLVGLPLAAHALGLGRLVVSSHLDEPLRGEIELLSPTPQELKTLTPSLAPRDEFDAAGIDRLPVLFNIKYEVVKRNDGRYYLTLKTDESLREPYLHMLLQVEWSGGRLIREYTALLDPPTWVAGQPAEVDVPEVAPEFVDAPVAAEPMEPAAPVAQAAAAAPEAMPPEAAAPGAPEPMEPVASAPPAEPDGRLGPTIPEPSVEPLPADEPPSAIEPAIADAAPAVAPLEPEPRWVSTEADWAATSEYGPVRRGETLSGITAKVRTDKSVSAEQVMLALLKANPKAFFGNNVNNLKAGAILRMPERDEIEAVPPTAARREFRAQYNAWQEYKLRLAAASQTVTVASAPPEPAAAPAVTPAAPVAPEKPATAKPEPAKPAKTPARAAAKVEVSDDLLKIVRANLDDKTRTDSSKTPGVDTRKDASSEQQELGERVATLEEAIESKDIETKDLTDRVGKMQDQVKNTARLIELENQQLAKAQQQAAESLKEQEKAQPKPAETVAAAPAEPAAPEPSAAKPPAAAQAPTPTPGEPVAVAPAAPEGQAPAAKTAPVPAKPTPAKPAIKRPAAPPPPVEEPSFLDSIVETLFGNTLTLAVLGGVGVLGLGILGMYLVRRRRAHAEFEESILSGGSLNTDAASVTDTGSQAASSDTSFLSDFSQGGMGNIHTDEVDPIAEAEVYLAYGRDEQAEEILKEAIVKDPARHELKQKLLEIYHQRNDVRGFETLAEELYAALEGQGGKIWEKVEEMGRKISPNNPMFSGGGGGRRPPSVAPTVMAAATEAAMPRRDMDDQPLSFDMSGTPSEPVSAPAASGGGLDFDLGVPAEPAPSAGEISFDMDLGGAPEPAPDSGGLDFDIRGSDTVDTGGSLDFEMGGGLEFESSDVAPGAVEEDLSFSMDSGTGGESLEFETATETVTEAGGEEEAESGQWDETATKLDLAKAYIDMGDAEGARSILDEVLAEGNESQKQQARDLAAQIG